jgi:predicted component of type VI protein secretion system
MGPGDPFDWQMPSVLALVGRRAGRWGLSLPDADLSSFHCTLLRTPIGAWIIDLLGQGGSLLNGRRVRWGRLDDGDELQIGRYRFTVSLRAVEDGRPSLRAARVSENGAGRVNHSGEQTSLTRNDQPAASASSTPTGGGSLVAVDAPPRTELTEAVMTSLFNQFATMQNQMFDQFQQAITMMVEMFSDMQREQVGLIRQEVDRLHQITAEIQTLQAEAARTTPPRRNDREAPAGAASPLDSQDFEEALTEMDVSEDRSAPRDAPREAADREDAESATSSGPPAEGDGEVHVWLYDKIAELQRERQSRLQRIIGFLRGK